MRGLTEYIPGVFVIAKPSAMFTRPQVHVSLTAKPYERRNVCVLPASHGQDHWAVVTRCTGGLHTHFTRAKVVAAVASGEMRWLDRFHNSATFTVVAAGTWQKTPSGPVHTMQMKVGMKGRHVPSTQREPEMEFEAVG